MGRLIDADNLQFNGRNYNKSQMKAILDFIDAQPTAYDQEKVVEQLEDYANEEMLYYKGTPYEKCIEVCIGKAIEIVQGSEARDVVTR